ncbi:feruloyl esterase B [Podospora didyma]|uniref:Carboxylic ester hydrolase n=1 Tax=Podospora didyma TaxID=330526 RepID=A0AAE0NG65_9PEZI|nr:feruloyl esterase B [Podospora didyma]
MAARPCDPSTFASVLPSNAIIEAAVSVANGSSYGEGAPLNIAFPTNPTNLPELCAITVRIPTSSSSRVRFGLFLPTAPKWNNRFLAVGNGAFAGGINWLDMGSGAQYGFASMSTDTGHNSSGADVTWALGNSATKEDFGYRAMHLSVTYSQKMVEAFNGKGWDWSYYSGCSTGGRQGLKEAQLYPDSFDGVLVGAPAWWTSHLQTWTTKVAKDNLPDGSPNRIPPGLFSVIAKEAVRQCDGADGVLDGIISAPEKCQLDLSKIQCGTEGVDASACLTAAQIQTAEKIYGDYITDDGKFAFPGLKVGSENLWGVVLGAPAPNPLGQDYIKYFLLDDASWKWETYNDSLVWRADALDPGHPSATKFDMSSFRDLKGGKNKKIIMYHGLADGLIPTGSSTYFYEQVASAMGSMSGVQDWFRYFLVPGMGHCAGTSVDAPWYIGGGNQAGSLGTGVYSTPGFGDAQHDILLGLMNWVEKGEPVDKVIATTWTKSSDATSGVLRQRPLCAYPKTARLEAGKDEKRAESWTCK